jgi:electron transfer flavoprotein alpha subunit
MIPPVYGPDEASGVWLCLEHENGELLGVSRELLGKGRELAAGLGVPVTGLLLGSQLGELALEAIAYGADHVLLAEHDALVPYTTDAHSAVVAAAVMLGKPDVLLLGATSDGRDLAGRLAVRLRTGLTADCTGLALEAETGLLLGDVVGFGGGIVAAIKCPQHRPQMVTVRPGAFVAPEANRARRGQVDHLPIQLDAVHTRTRVLERRIDRGVDITKADSIVVAGGGTAGDLAMVEELAALLGAEVGATRVATDAGWVDRTRMIGQTGSVTRPKLAVLCGVSGAMQFTVGIDAAETVVAINLDGQAPIFDAADYGVVGDLRQVLPSLVRELRRSLTAEGGGAG